MRKTVRKFETENLQTSPAKTIPVVIGVSMNNDDEPTLINFLHKLEGWKNQSAVLLTCPGRDCSLQAADGWKLTAAHDRETIRPGIMYTAPENHVLSVSHGRIRLHHDFNPAGIGGPVDTLFNALATETNPSRIAVVLSSEDADGVSGMNNLHNAGGITMVYNRMHNRSLKEKLIRYADISGGPETLAEYLDKLLHKKLPSLSNIRSDQPWLRLFSTTIAQTGDAVMITDALNDEQIIYINDQFSQLTGYLKYEVIGRAPDDFLFQHFDPEESSKHILPEHHSDDLEKKILTRSKSIRWISQKMIPCFDAADTCTHFIHLIKDVTESRKRDQALTMAVYAAKEKLRQDLSAELHDNVNQILVTAQVTLGMAKNADPAEAVEWIQRSNQYIGLAVEEIRRLSHDIAPQVFDTDTFCIAVRDLVNGINADKRFQLRFHFDAELARLKPDNELLLNLYRIIQEQLKNILSYAEATRISLSLGVSQGHSLRLRIADNGRGFDSATTRKGMGITNMRRRAEFFNGSFELIAAEGKGCVVIVEMPV